MTNLVTVRLSTNTFRPSGSPEGFLVDSMQLAVDSNNYLAGKNLTPHASRFILNLLAFLQRGKRRVL
jgi:hypothetical protein